MLNEVKSAFGGKKLIGVLLGLVLLLTAASPAIARRRGCWHCEGTKNGRVWAITFCRNPEEPISSAEATAESPDGEARARAISIVIVDDGDANITNTALAIANTGGNTQE